MALAYGLLGEFTKTYEVLDVVNAQMFAYENAFLEIKKQLGALGRTVEKPEYKRIQGLLKICEKMEQETRNRPIDKFMYRG